MHIGRQLLTPDSSSRSVFSEWMPRGGDSAVFPSELITVFAADFTVEVYHKNSEETGSGSLVGTIVSGQTAVGQSRATIGSLKELVRYRVTVTGAGTGTASTGAVLYRMLAPTWFDKAMA